MLTFFSCSSIFFELDVHYTMTLLLEMGCLFFIVFKFSVGAQKDSDRAGIRTHERKAYWNSSPTPWPFGLPVAIFWERPKIAVYSAPVFFSIVGYIQHPHRIRVCSYLYVVFPRFSEPDVFWTLSLLLRMSACHPACLSFRWLSKRIPTEMGFEPTHGNRIGLAVQLLNHSATLSMFLYKSQNLLSILHFPFSWHYQVCPTSSN